MHEILQGLDHHTKTLLDEGLSSAFSKAFHFHVTDLQPSNFLSKDQLPPTNLQSVTWDVQLLSAMNATFTGQDNVDDA